MNRLVYRSKIDIWLGVTLGLSEVICVITAVSLLVNEVPGAMPIAVFTVAIGAILPIWLTSSTYYEFDDDNLHVRCGPLRWTIPINEIHSVTPTHNPLSSPALSLDRLRINHAGGSLMISPRDKEGFLRELKRRQDTT